MMAITRKNQTSKNAIMEVVFMMKMRGIFAFVKFTARTLAKPLGTVFEIRDDVKEPFRRVNRFVYIHHVWREMKALTKKYPYRKEN